MDEEWRGLVDWPLYEVSDFGRVRNRETGHVLTPWLTHKGYLCVELHRNKRGYKRHVHRLVCEAWHGPSLPGAQAAHLDGSRTNNIPSNLIWATNTENCRHRELHGRTARGERCGGAKLSNESVRRISGLVGLGETQKAIAERFGVSEQAIHCIAAGKTWTHITGFQRREPGRQRASDNPSRTY